MNYRLDIDNLTWFTYLINNENKRGNARKCRHSFWNPLSTVREKENFNTNFDIKNNNRRMREIHEMNDFSTLPSPPKGDCKSWRLLRIFHGNRKKAWFKKIFSLAEHFHGWITTSRLKDQSMYHQETTISQKGYERGRTDNY